MWLLAFSLNGFFLYLALLDAVDVSPSTPLTGAYYGALGAGLVAAVWRRREILASRLRSLGSRSSSASPLRPRLRAGSC